MIDAGPIHQAALATAASLGLVAASWLSGAHGRTLWAAAALPLAALALLNPIAGLWASAWPRYALASAGAFGLAFATALAAAYTFARAAGDRALVFAGPLFTWAYFTLFTGTIRGLVALAHQLV